jgi:hypothetical protein
MQRVTSERRAAFIHGAVVESTEAGQRWQSSPAKAWPRHQLRRPAIPACSPWSRDVVTGITDDLCPRGESSMSNGQFQGSAARLFQ